MSITQTPKLLFDQLNEGQDGGEITHNAWQFVLDSLVMPSIIDRDLTAPPGGESAGDMYIPNATATAIRPRSTDQ